jgi:hypothetical protein
MISEVTDADEDRAPICPYCGVTALPAESDHHFDSRFVCENPDCDAFGEIVLHGDPGN